MAMIALVAASASGCGSSGKSAASASPTAAAAKSLELIVGTKSDNFYVTMECGAKQEAAKLGAHITVTGPHVLDQPHGHMEIHPVWNITAH